MADTRFIGAAGGVAEVDTITIAGTHVAQTDTVTITLNGKDLVVTVGTSNTSANFATAIKEAINGETFTDNTAVRVPADGGPAFPEFALLTATVSGAVVTITGDQLGVPWNIGGNMTAVHSNDPTGTATLAAATAATGPEHWDNADNWSGGAVPTTEDTYIDNWAGSIKYGMDQVAQTLASLNIANSFTGDLGLPATNADGYSEFRTRYMTINATIVRIGYGAGTGSGRLLLDTSSGATTITVENTGAAADTALGAFIWKGTNAGTFNVLDGSVSVAPFDGEAATITTLLVANGTVDVSDGVTLTTVTNQAGTVDVRSNVTTLTNATGTVTVREAATVNELNLNGGFCVYASSGTITTANIGGGINPAQIDFGQDNRTPKTITNCNLKTNGTILDPLKVVTFSNGILLAAGVTQVTAA